ncbi:hypothetical protein PC129_g6634 [Phytophthora cactorum]|uniref:Uncharacterized protein n=1 Tax=Phytophthora cactorum TaxID=29920 RepID=A0A8T1DV72_9STRA|nr:hypothetical protein PC113_g9257 [Phytophthora cactorum]KAG2912295.1 hypothetical protein PC114_g8950 [Phytophthora cactorum]KAG2943381.1 hypothetical protein PC117_g9467 [Phytophthora cactorum]KAG2985428.1 hypothetical protein PC118_g8334 [Phytophthora cactorum]KAG3025042.1 hypothetical protein PC120_g6723 [Phytophthora cactorum]
MDEESRRGRGDAGARLLMETAFVQDCASEFGGYFSLQDSGSLSFQKFKGTNKAKASSGVSCLRVCVKQRRPDLRHRGDNVGLTEKKTLHQGKDKL